MQVTIQDMLLLPGQPALTLDLQLQIIYKFAAIEAAVPDLVANYVVNFVLTSLPKTNDNRAIMYCLAIFNRLSEQMQVRNLVVNDPSINTELLVERLAKYKDRAITRLTFRLLINLMASDKPRAQLLQLSPNVLAWITDYLTDLNTREIGPIQSNEFSDLRRLGDQSEALLLIPYFAVNAKLLQHLKAA